MYIVFVRRWPVWLGGGLLVAAAVFLVLVLVLGRSNAPFAFLEGQVPIKMPGAVQRLYDESGLNIRTYSFQADADALERKMRSELGAEGFVQLSPKVTDGALVFGKADAGGDPSIGEDPLPQAWQSISLHKDQRLDPKTLATRQEKGWVILGVSEKRARSVFDSARSWLGL